MWTASTGDLDHELIDRVLARGADMAPLLTGMLNLYGEDLLDDVDDALVVRSLALLGEIGDPAAIPALAPFLPLEDETFSNVVHVGVSADLLSQTGGSAAPINLANPDCGNLRPHDSGAASLHVAAHPGPHRSTALH